MKFLIRKFIPTYFFNILWGNRSLWGLVADEDDKCWKEWQKTLPKFYSENQREGIGTKINDAGYRIMKNIDLENKTVLEIGAGDIRHLKYMTSKPEEFIVADIDKSMMEFAEEILKQKDIKHKTVILERNSKLPIPDNSIDVIISFYSLEHLHPLDEYLKDMHRVLKPGGIMIGAIPAEGGLAWGLGRVLTSRRWMNKYTNIDYDKIICWEHPNFADKVDHELKKIFIKDETRFWPIPFLPLLDVNLIFKFKYKKE